MSESIPMTQDPPQPKKDSPESPKEKGQNSRVIIATALMTALTTIGVAFIGIVPQLARADSETIKELREKINVLQSKPDTKGASVPSVTEKKMSVHGTVKTEDGKKLLNNVEVNLLPVTNNTLTATTNEDGTFDFEDVPAGVYWVIVRNPSGKSSRRLLEKPVDELTVKDIGVRVKYHIAQ